MASFSSKRDEAYFGFIDLPGFLDFIAEVIMCAPDQFMPMDWVGPDQQMNVQRAFEGLRYGMRIAAGATRNLQAVANCQLLVDQAQKDYESGREDAGRSKLLEVEKLVKSLG